MHGQAWYTMSLYGITLEYGNVLRIYQWKDKQNKGQTQTIESNSGWHLRRWHSGNDGGSTRTQPKRLNGKQLSGGDIAQINIKMTWFIHAHSTLRHCCVSHRSTIFTFDFELNTEDDDDDDKKELNIYSNAPLLKSFRRRESHVRRTEYRVHIPCSFNESSLAHTNHCAMLCHRIEWNKKKIKTRNEPHEKFALFFRSTVASLIKNAISTFIRGL